MSLYNIIDRSERACIQAAYKMKLSMEKLARWKNHLTFMIKCRNHKLVPKGFRVNLPSKSKKGRRIADRTGLALMREQIKTVRVNKITTSRKIDSLRQQLAELTTEDKLIEILSWSENNAERVFVNMKVRQQKKLKMLLSEQVPSTNQAKA